MRPPQPTPPSPPPDPGGGWEVLLVGTVHGDPEGAPALAALLEAVRPAAVTVEISEYAVEFRKLHAARLLDRLRATVTHVAGRAAADVAMASGRIRALQTTVALPYEWTVPVEWAGRQEPPVPVVPADLSSYSRRFLALLGETLETDNVRRLLEDREFDLGREVMAQRSLARRYLRDASLFKYHFDDEERAEMAERGRHMARTIGELAVTVPGPGRGTVLHVGGWHHLVRSRDLVTLAGLLPEARRRLLFDG